MVILLWVLLGIICVLLVIIAKQKEKMKIQKESNKKVLDEWKWRYGICHNMRRLLFFSTDMHKIEEYMVSQNIQRIAVYGLGVTGETFIKQMEEVKIQIAYIIGVKKTDYNIEVRMLNEVKNDVDLIVVTEENDYPDVYRELISRINIPIVPLSRLLDEVHLTGLYSIDIPAE